MKKFQLNVFALMTLALSLFVFTACDNSDDDNNDLVTGNVVVKENITANTTWTKDRVYQLGGRITVVSGVTLTIEAGTIIKGEAGTGASATALLIARGAKIKAEGTAAAPIIFTSVADEITPAMVAAGNFKSPNFEPNVNGLWGGVLILGKAPISASNKDTKVDVSEVQIEGIPTSDTNGLYGGSVSDDDSGVLKYVSIRHGGAEIGSGNEINGLTLGGVGSKTVIENIEVVGNQDDGIEWFGGSVSVKNAIVWNAGDDAIDTDQSWSGTLDNFVVIAPSDHNFELDGPEGSMKAGHIIKNGTVLANDGNRKSVDLINVDANSMVTLENIFITGIAAGQQVKVSNKDDFSGAPDVELTNIQLKVTAEALPTHVKGAVPAGVKAVEAKQAGADISKLSWSWAAQANKLAGL